ncbi:TetR family transcriptional regulator [Rhizocola hellebori]|uniref:TetR family transcriptional regulator n=1 Tax=Rhizocola hellebori TaxID=1392758 RepID=A0A8J3VJL7_9ACTN|nr:TetR/AcrR family transcriptional regulator [Rhizocola hellebori]GIH08607.1 TetR family transcriptional regulator [Rhizocola hellebori]
MSITASPARSRLLDTAARLFYTEGIQAVGVDRLVSEAKITRATFYRQFPAKDELVRAYLERTHQAVRTKVEELAKQAKTPRDLISALVGWLVELACTPGTRGCAFINAAAEYPDPDHPVRVLIAEHRRSVHQGLRQLFADAGHPHPQQAATTLMLLRDGAMVGGALDDPAATRAALKQAVSTLLEEYSPH